MSETRSLYEKRRKIYARVIAGRSQIFRILTTFVIYGLYFGVPWLTLNGEPLVHFDLGARQFHLFGTTFWPQDFMFLAWFLIIAAFALFLFTTVAGRLWCGYACPQTIWTLAFIWIEEKIEGPPNKRKKLDNAPLSTEKVAKKISKHFIWLIMSVVTGFTFVAYFYPAPELLNDLLTLEAPAGAWVWVGIFTYLTYIDAAWLREQVCIYMCPYARFQSVMYDEDTLMVSYNPDVAEPRARLKHATEDSGNCIECDMCVQVCPTGIDIRDGVQISCINCGLCEDACADVMKSVGREPNLIAFTSMNANHKTKALRIMRPKVLAYIAVLTIMVSLFAYNLANRSLIDSTIIRDRDTLFKQTRSQQTANEYLLKITNKTTTPYSIKLALEEPGFTIEPNEAFTINEAELIEHNFKVISQQPGKGARDINVKIIRSDGETLNTLRTRFIYPP